MAQICDINGVPLASASLRSSDDGRALLLSRVDGGGQLLQYYFSRSGRVVRIEDEDRCYEGILATRWQGSRRLWSVAVTAPAGAVPEPGLARIS